MASYLLSLKSTAATECFPKPNSTEIQFLKIVSGENVEKDVRKIFLRMNSGLSSGPSHSISWKQSEMKSLSHVRIFATPWTIAYQVPPSMGFSRQECWSGLPFPCPGDLPNPGKPGSLALQTDALPSQPSLKIKFYFLAEKSPNLIPVRLLILVLCSSFIF